MFCSPASNCWPIRQIAELENQFAPGTVIDGAKAWANAALLALCQNSSVFRPRISGPGHAIPAMPQELCSETKLKEVSHFFAMSYTYSPTRFKLPGLIVLARNVQDVIIAVDFARTNNVQLAVRNTGHAYNGQSSVEGGLIIDVSGMSGIHVNVQTSTIRVEAGAIWGPTYQAANAEGFIVVGGHDPTVGVVGCMIGGCYGEFSRLHGFSADNVLEMEVVVPGHGAERRVVTEKSDPDLFWALRGGGAGLGIITSLTMKMYKAPPRIHRFTMGNLCPGMPPDPVKRRQWVTHNGVAHASKILFNGTWWGSLPPDWSVYPTLCSGQLLYVGNDLHFALQAPAIKHLEASSQNSFAWLQSYRTQWEYHNDSADVYNYKRSVFTNIAPSSAELNLSLASAVIQLISDGSILDIFGNGMLGGNAAMAPQGGNAVGDGLRRSSGVELVLGCVQDKCAQGDIALQKGEGAAEAAAFVALQHVADVLYPLVKSSYLNEWVAGGGLNLMGDWQARFWGIATYKRLLTVKRNVDPCNTFYVEKGVGSDQQHCAATGEVPLFV